MFLSRLQLDMFRSRRAMAPGVRIGPLGQLRQPVLDPIVVRSNSTIYSTLRACRHSGLSWIQRFQFNDAIQIPPSEND